MSDRAIETLADSITQYQPHPIAQCWPSLEGAEFTKMCESLVALGLVHAITLYQGAILDGVTRYRGCRATGVKPHYREYEGDDPVGYALACNESRRQLDPSQRAMVAARLAQLQRGANQHASRDASSTESKHASRDASGTTQTEAANLMHVGRAQVQRARVVQERGVPELVAAVDGRRITVATAARLAEETTEIQRAIASKLVEGMSAASAIREVKGDPSKADVSEASGREPVPRIATLDEKQVLAAYQALEPAAQERVFRRISAERTKAAKIDAAKAEAERRTKFESDLARVSGGRSTVIEDPLMAALAQIEARVET